MTDHYSIAETPFKRDIVGELVKAGRAHGLGVILYYSHIDWHDWDFGWDNRNFWFDPKFTQQSQPATLGRVHREGAASRSPSS